MWRSRKTFSLCPKAYNILSDFDVSIEKKKLRSFGTKQKEECSIPALQEEKEKKDSNKINEDNVRNLSLAEDKIKQICNRYNISVNIIFLTTSCGYWRVYVDGEKVTKVFHGNYRMKMNDCKKKKKCNEGFHQQKISATKFEDVVRYIHYHDKKRYSNYKKTNVEILLEKISLEDLKN